MFRPVMTILATLLFASSLFGATAASVVKRFCELDRDGARLSSDTWKSVASLVTWPDEPGWDHVTVISGFRISASESKGNKATVVVVYDVAGAAPETVRFQLVRTEGTWKIDAPSIEPHVSRAAAGIDAAAPEELSCKAEMKFEGGAFEQHELKLKRVGGRITGLAYSNVMSNGQEGGAYFCELDLTEASPNVEWVRSGNTTRIVEHLPDRDSSVEVKALAAGAYEVVFDMSPIAHCGFGSEFPDRIVLKPNRKKCIVHH